MINIRVPSTGQIYEMDVKEKFLPHQWILVEVDHIIESALICSREAEKTDTPIKFLRILTEEDRSVVKKLKQQAQEYLLEAQAKVMRHSLEMKIVDADLSFDEKKLTFYFSAEGRVDFRSLVADMVGSFRKIIRLQQIGSREQAKLYGGYGKCGRELCCTKFLNNPENINLDNLQEGTMIKSNKSMGCCGKLMCCLSFETDTKGIMKKNKNPLEDKEAKA